MSSVEELLSVPNNRGELVNGRISAEPEAPWRLVGIAVAWVLLGIACAFAVGVVIGPIQVTFQLQKTPAFNLLLQTLAASAVGAILFAASMARGRIVGNGNLRLGLGLIAVERLPIVVFLGIAIVGYAALRDYALFKLRPNIFYQLSSANSFVVLLHVLIVVIVAPVAEEVFFRGWLWNGLRRSWGALPVALLTTAFWLVLHADPNFAAYALIVALLPVGLLLALARQVSKGVQASICLHAIYNLVVVLPMLLMASGLLHQDVPVQQNRPVQQESLIQQSAPAKQDKPSDASASPQRSGPAQQSTLPQQSVLVQRNLLQQYGLARQAQSSTSASADANVPIVVNREVFAASESQIAAMNFVNADCASDSVPEVRVFTPPASGKTRLQRITIVISRPTNEPLSRCNGKPVEAMGVFYKSNDDFKGVDKVVVDVDFHHGKVTRFIYNISVR